MKTDSISHEGRDLGCIMNQFAKNTDNISHEDRDLGCAKGRKEKRK